MHIMHVYIHVRMLHCRGAECLLRALTRLQNSNISNCNIKACKAFDTQGLHDALIAILLLVESSSAWIHDSHNFTESPSGRDKKSGAWETGGSKSAVCRICIVALLLAFFWGELSSGTDNQDWMLWNDPDPFPFDTCGSFGMQAAYAADTIEFLGHDRSALFSHQAASLKQKVISLMSETFFVAFLSNMKSNQSFLEAKALSHTALKWRIASCKGWCCTAKQSFCKVVMTYLKAHIPLCWIVSLLLQNILV